MPPFRLVQVSDTHLSRTHAYFADNWAVFREAMRADPPDLIVHSGDVSFNGPVAADDLAFAAAEMAGLGIPFRVIAGNHDIGEAPAFSRLDQPVNTGRIAAWRAQFGGPWWQHDIPGWRLVGVDTALMGSGLAEEAEQLAFLASALDGRPAMLFMHMPPFDRDPGDASPTTSYIPHAARGAFLDLCAAGGVKVIGCGHLHIHRRMRHRGMEIVWAPATAMVNVKAGLKHFRRFPRPGWLEWTLTAKRATFRLVEPERMFVIDMTGWTKPNGNTTTTLPPLPLRGG